MSWSRGDIELQQAVAGDSALLDGYVALRVSQSAWVLGWAKDAIAGQPQASTTAAFLDTGRILFDSYRVTETSFDASIAASISHVQDLSSAFATGGLVVEVGVGMGGLLLWWRQRRALRQAIVGPVSSILQTLAIAVPMIVGARVVGVIEAGADHPVELSTVDMELIDTLSSQAATAIEAARLYERAEELGRTDALTLLPNRRDLDSTITSELARASRYGRSVAVAMLDLDHFKTVNDSFGHARGDEVLQQVAAVMRSVLRDVDTIYRYGGEEFLLLMPETDCDSGVELCDRLREAVTTRVTLPKGRRLTLSGGVAAFPPRRTPRPG